ncbi:3-keto-disaccharide hydrolase [Fibrella arboris]|uniref:3-keto-disaccharide hydrolase n=1 Tax=Fibrella arboris TaxID=3242486 RepID=UPI0035213ED8
MKKLTSTFAFLLVSAGFAFAQNEAAKKTPESSETWTPVPPIVTPGTMGANASGLTAPSDAIVLFDGKNTDEWVSVKSHVSKDWKDTNMGPLKWAVKDGAMYSTLGSYARTKREFENFQLHVEFRTPEKPEGKSQARGNSGVFLQGYYEIQVLDNYDNPTYSNGQVGSVYKQAIPLANPSRKPGEWQTYDIVYQAPRFNKSGILAEPGYVTVLLNGIVVQHHTAIKGNTDYIGYPTMEPHGAGPILLQDHGNPVGFRNIWIREL